MALFPEENCLESLYLKTLVEVVRSGSLSRAADILHVTQPAVSRRVKFMEDQYGCALLDRSGSTLRPTEAGRLVYEKAKALLEIEADLVTGLHRLDGRARISFSCTPSFGIAHLPVILREFMLACAETADLKFIFNTPDVMFTGLGDGTFDLAVMELCERFDLSAFSTFPLPGDEMVFVSSPRLGLEADTTALEALFALPLFARREGCCSRMLLEKNLACAGHDFQEFRKVIVFDDLHVIMQAVLDGEGIAFLSRDVLGDHLTSGRLVPHHVPSFTHVRDRALVLGPHDSLAGPLLQFARSLFGRFGQPMPEALEGPAAPALAGATAPLSGIVPVPASRAQASGRAPARRPTGSRSNQRSPVR
jgi:DNA-binding transcriptional LysR family regulator